MNGFVYILKSSKNGKFYVGSTVNIQNRLHEHNSGEVVATKYLRPWILVFSQEYTEVGTARRIEFKLKRMKSRLILEKIIEDKFIRLKA